jgi:hypothetical protein
LGEDWREGLAEKRDRKSCLALLSNPPLARNKKAKIYARVKALNLTLFQGKRESTY